MNSSSANSNSGNNPSSLGYYCHVCNRDIQPLMVPNPTCPHCHGEFIEEIEADNNPRAFHEAAQTDEEQPGGGYNYSQSFGYNIPGLFGMANTNNDGADRGASSSNGAEAAISAILANMFASGSGTGFISVNGQPPIPLNRNGPANTNDTTNNQQRSTTHSDSTATGNEQTGSSPNIIQRLTSWVSSYINHANPNAASSTSTPANDANTSNVDNGGPNSRHGAWSTFHTSYSSPGPNAHISTRVYTFSPNGGTTSYTSNNGGNEGEGEGGPRQFRTSHTFTTRVPSSSSSPPSADDDGSGQSTANSPFAQLFRDFMQTLDPNDVNANIIHLLSSALNENTAYYNGAQASFDDIITQILNQTGDVPNANPGISDEAIDKLPMETIKELAAYPNGIPNCAICTDDFTPEEQARKLPCEHIYHDGCIRPWLKQSSTCPVCRAPLGANTDNTAEASRSASDDTVAQEPLD
ncbi:hypothetical protein BDF22DRAFT_662958 [Syncephalis plumigaleata]|nr:hypothetical protein BDF22DRAFT_662958 [Syncephalis plumigaleata]